MMPQPVLLPDFGEEERRLDPVSGEGFVPFGRVPDRQSEHGEIAFAPHRPSPSTDGGAADNTDPRHLGPDTDQVSSDAPAAAGAAALQAKLNAAFAGDEADTLAQAPGSDIDAPRPAAALDAHMQEQQALVAQLHAQIEAMQAAHDAELAQLAARATSAATDAAVSAVMEGLSELLSHPIFEATTDLALIRFRDELTALLGATDAVTVQVRGPGDLLERLRAHWPEGVDQPDMVETEGLELVARVDRAVLSTRIEELRAILLGGRS